MFAVIEEQIWRRSQKKVLHCLILLSIVLSFPSLFLIICTLEMGKAAMGWGFFFLYLLSEIMSKIPSMRNCSTSETFLFRPQKSLNHKKTQSQQRAQILNSSDLKVLYSILEVYLMSPSSQCVQNKSHAQAPPHSLPRSDFYT